MDKGQGAKGEWEGAGEEPYVGRYRGLGMPTGMSAIGATGLGPLRGAEKNR